MRFPAPLTRCDSPHRSSLDPSIPIVIETSGDRARCPVKHDGGEKKSKLRRKNDVVDGVSRNQRAGVAMIAAKSYRQGYIDASSYHLLHPPPPQVLHRSVVPEDLTGIASQYPYVTIAVMGLGAGLLFSASAYLGHRAFRSLTHEGASLQVMTPEFWARKMDNLERRVTLQVQAATAENRKEFEGLRRDFIQHNRKIGGVISPLPGFKAGVPGNGAVPGDGNTSGNGMTSSGDVESKIKDLEGQVIAANRDRRSELQAFRAELMGQLGVLEDLAKTSQAPPPTPGSLKIGGGPLLDKNKRNKSTGMDSAPIAPHFDEARLGQVLRSAVEDVLDARSASGTGSAEWAQSSLKETQEKIQSAIDELGDIPDYLAQVSHDVEDLHDWAKLVREDIGKITSHLGIPIEVEPPRDLPEEWDEPDYEEYEEFEPVKEKSRSAYPNPPSKSKTSEEKAKDEATRAELYDKINETKEKYQSIMDSAPVFPAGISADEMAEELHKAAGKIKQKTVGSARAAEQPSSQFQKDAGTEGVTTQAENPKHVTTSRSQAEEGSQHTATSARTTTSLNSTVESRNVQDDLAAFPSNAHAPKMGTLDYIAQKIRGEYKNPEVKETAKPHPNEPRSTVHPGPRLGVDDSGNWSFVIPNAAPDGIHGAGWRNADVFYEKGLSLVRRGRNYILSSSSSGSDTYGNVKLFFYPEFDIVRLDGHLWRCTRLEHGKWVIKEKIGEVKEPEWDGVGFEKD